MINGTFYSTNYTNAMRISARLWGRRILVVFFVLAGANHFVNPKPYLSMMPAYLPWPAVLVWISGAFEIIGGLSLLVRSIRIFAAWGLIALLIAVFPANLNVALQGWPGVHLPQWILWARLPFQIVFIGFIYRVCIERTCESH